MKKTAFTLIEIIFVVIIIGILSAVIAPSVKRATLKEAADQIAAHIRYTQQLALNENKFLPNDSTWYKTRWQIAFFNTAGTDNEWAYTIFSDKNKDTNANSGEIAKNPLNTNQLLTGGYSGTYPYILGGEVNPKITKSMNIGHKYGITSVTFSGGCTTSRSRRIYFDYVGRPMYLNPATLTSKYYSGTQNRLIRTDCKITLSNGSKSKTIVIIPETGYVYIE